MTKKRLRSQDWFGKQDKDGFIHRSWLKNQGYPDDLFDGRPVIGICNTYSELNPCNSHFRTLAEAVKIGLMVILLGVVLTMYKDVVVIAFLGTFMATATIFSMAFFVRDYD